MELLTLLSFAVVLPSETWSLGIENELDLYPSPGHHFITNDRPQNLNCSYVTANHNLELAWSAYGKDDTELDLDDLTQTIHQEQARMDGGQLMRHTYNIRINSYDDLTYDGRYSCFVKDNTNGTSTLVSTIYLHGVDERRMDGNLGNETLEVVSVTCDIGIDDNDYEVSGPIWYFGEKAVTDLKDSELYTEVMENASLIIRPAEREVAGVYTAKYQITNQHGNEYPFNCNVTIFADPYVKDFEKSKNLIEDENMQLQCSVLGYPKSIVTWYKDGKVLNASDSRITKEPLNGYLNGKLKINSVEFSDAGIYTCSAYSLHLNKTSSKDISIHVKDKLAALWPFLGIVGEVFVLCTIIFIYEKRRNKQAQQADDDAQDTSKPSEKRGNVRNRRNQS